MRVASLRQGGTIPAVATLLVSLLFTLSPGDAQMGLAGAVVVSVISATSVWLSGCCPGAALALIGAAVVAQPLLDVRFGAVDLVVVLVACRAAMRPGLRPWVLVLVTFVILTVHDWWSRPLTERGLDPSLLYPVLLTALAVGLGLQGRRIAEQREELRRLRDADRERATLEERRRIARDLHDVAAHHLSSLVVHNRLALRLGTDDALQTAVEFSACTAADTLQALRHVVGVLSADGEPARGPTSMLADLPSVLELVSAAGLDVQLDVDEPAVLGQLDEELQIALLRIAQESLSNVLRHRGPGPCWVGLHRVGRTVRLRVEDDGRGAGTTEDPDGATTAAVRTVGAGHGVLGMRERARSRGGRLTVGPSLRGGMRVEAVFDVRPEQV